MTPRDPDELGSVDRPVDAEIAAGTTMGPVELSVADLARSLDYYQHQIGLQIIEAGRSRAGLGAGDRELLHVIQEPGAQPSPRSTGLFHFALLVPRRVDLARWLAHAARDRVQLTGMSDHFVSEALYLDDPDGHGIEIYWDRPRETWEGQVAERMTTLHLDVDSLFGELADPATEPFEAIAAGTVVGHVHLKVAHVAEAVAFYRDEVGMGLMAYLGDSAGFLSAGGYHHHIGANSWQSRGAAPPPPGSAALRHATVVLPDAAIRDQLLERLRSAGRAVEDTPEGPACADPSGNRMLLAVT
jgi:catechol 2,3-dioxygenase